MSLSSNKLNGHPTKEDPNPAARARRFRTGNDWPAARAGRAKKMVDGTPAEQKRRVQLAAANRQRAINAIQNKKLLEIYAVPEPVKVPGEKVLYSRWLRERGDKRTRFANMAAFCLHILENYGDDEKEEQWRHYQGEVDPTGDTEEECAEATLQAITNLERQSVSAPVVGTSDLPPDFIAPEVILDEED